MPHIVNVHPNSTLFSSFSPAVGGPLFVSSAASVPASPSTSPSASPAGSHPLCFPIQCPPPLQIPPHNFQITSSSQADRNDFFEFWFQRIEGTFLIAFPVWNQLPAYGWTPGQWYKWFKKTLQCQKHFFPVLKKTPVKFRSCMSEIDIYSGEIQGIGLNWK